jgi:hypothetical protein
VSRTVRVDVTVETCMCRHGQIGRRVRFVCLVVVRTYQHISLPSADDNNFDRSTVQKKNFDRSCRYRVADDEHDRAGLIHPSIHPSKVHCTAPQAFLHLSERMHAAELTDIHIWVVAS